MNQEPSDPEFASSELAPVGLPASLQFADLPAHNALMDALATAELLIAHSKHRGGREQLKLRDLL